MIGFKLLYEKFLQLIVTLFVTDGLISVIKTRMHIFKRPYTKRWLKWTFVLLDDGLSLCRAYIYTVTGLSKIKYIV